MARRVISPILIGREGDVATLRAAVDACASDDRCVAVVAGDAGIGKTRLLRELAADLLRGAEAPFVVAWGSCIRLSDVDVPFSPVPAILDGLARAATDGAALAAVERARQALIGSDHVAAPATRVEGGRGVRRLRTFELVVDVIRSITGRSRRRLLMVVDDLQWADPASLDLIAFLARRLGRSGVLIALACRAESLAGDSPARRLILDLERDCVLERIDVRPLTLEQVHRQISAIEEGHPGLHDPALIAARSEGNPFVVEELLRLEPGAPTVPDSLFELLRARLAGLDEPERRLVDATAVVGRPARRELLGAVTGIPPGALEQVLRATAAAGILVDTDGEIGFRHSLFGEAATADLGPLRARTLHAAVAKQLEAGSGARPSVALLLEIANHLDLAGDVDRALPALLTAAKAAGRAFAWSSAAVALERAAELGATGCRPAPEVVEIARQASRMWTDASDPRRALRQLRRAARLAGRLGCPDQRVRCWAETAHLHNEIGSPERGYRLVERIAASQEPATDPALQLHLDLVTGATRVIAGRYRSGRELLESSLERALARGMREEAAGAAGVLGHVLGALGDADGAAATFQLAIDVAPPGSPDALEAALINRVDDAIALGDWEAYATAMRAARPLRTAFGAEHEQIILGYLLYLEAEAAVLMGDIAASLQAIDAGAGLSPDFHAHHGLLAVEARAAAVAGDHTRALAAVERGVAATFWCPWHRAFLRAGEALVHLSRGRPDLARGAAELALADIGVDDSISDPAIIWCLVVRVAAELAASRRAPDGSDAREELIGWARPAATRLERLASGEFGEGCVVRPVNRARGALGVATWARAVGTHDVAAWRNAVRRLEAAGLRYDEAVARVCLAEALLATGRERHEAAAELIRASEYARSAPAAPLERDILALARRARVTLPEAGAGPARSDGSPLDHPMAIEREPWGLSPREREVLDLLIDGSTNREIAEALFITDKTASSHVTHILDKLGVGSRVEAALLAARVRGLG